MIRLVRWLERRLSVRARSTMLASLVVGAALLVGSLLLLWIYTQQLTARLDATLEQGAQTRAQLLDEGVAPEAAAELVLGEAMVWIGRPDGTELVPTNGPIQPVSAPLPDRIGTTSELYLEASRRSVEEAREHGPGGEDEHQDEGEDHDEEAEHEGDDDGDDEDDDDEGEEGGPATIELRVASAATRDGSTIVVVGAQVEGLTGAIGSLGRLFLVGLPPLVALVAWLTWATAGWALSPVERIRAQASAISGANLDERVPVPEAKDEIHHLAETVNAMLTRIEAHDRSLRQFTADASHELKSPVANLRALVDTASVDDPGWPVLRSALAAESDRLRDLVENLLYLAAFDAGRPRPATTAVSLDELLFREAEVVAATGRVALDIGGVEPALVTGVESDLARLVRNLVDNAVRHATGRISLAVELEGGGAGVDGGGSAVGVGVGGGFVPGAVEGGGRADGGGAVTLVVGDDGPGVPDDDRDRIFDRFTRLDASRQRGDGGAGLGLAIVSGIAEDHGATVSVGRSPLGGAEFRVRFPN